MSEHWITAQDHKEIHHIPVRGLVVIAAIDPRRVMTRPEREAVANKITAAPDLVEALREIMDCPCGLDQATVTPGRSADDMPDYQAVCNMSIAWTKIKNARTALKKAGVSTPSD